MVELMACFTLGLLLGYLLGKWIWGRITAMLIETCSIQKQHILALQVRLEMETGGEQ
jgi:hypothetical protein